MNAFTWTFVAVVFLVGDFYLGVTVGRLLKQDEPNDDFDPLPRRLSPQVPDQWKPTEEHLHDPRERDRPEPPSSPAS